MKPEDMDKKPSKDTNPRQAANNKVNAKITTEIRSANISLDNGTMGILYNQLSPTIRTRLMSNLRPMTPLEFQEALKNPNSIISHMVAACVIEAVIQELNAAIAANLITEALLLKLRAYREWLKEEREERRLRFERAIGNLVDKTDINAAVKDISAELRDTLFELKLELKRNFDRQVDEIKEHQHAKTVNILHDFCKKHQLNLTLDSPEVQEAVNEISQAVNNYLLAPPAQTYAELKNEPLFGGAVPEAKNANPELMDPAAIAAAEKQNEAVIAKQAEHKRDVNYQIRLIGKLDELFQQKTNKPIPVSLRVQLSDLLLLQAKPSRENYRAIFNTYAARNNALDQKLILGKAEDLQELVELAQQGLSQLTAEAGKNLATATNNANRNQPIPRPAPGKTTMNKSEEEKQDQENNRRPGAIKPPRPKGFDTTF